jgi:hypothetical protein
VRVKALRANDIPAEGGVLYVERGEGGGGGGCVTREHGGGGGL